MDLVPESSQLYKDLNLKHEPINLITPQFECPMPPLESAVFPPCLKELPPPSLDLFDIDDQFSSEKARLAQLTNKCTDDDVDYYVLEAGEILGISHFVEKREDPKHILYYVFSELVKFKKLNQD